VGVGTAKPGIDLRGPTTSIDGRPPQTNSEWNRLRQRTLMLPAPEQPGAVTGAARIGPLQVSCEKATATTDDSNAVEAYDSATVSMLTKKYAKPVSAGDNHACALKDGSVYCWGANNRGQLGNGGNEDSSLPVAVKGISTAIQISAGEGRFVGSPDAHTCALLRDGTVKCWGAGTEGQLGNKNLIDAFEPVLVQGITNAIQVSTGGQYTCALIDNGDVLCWGVNHSGQLGNGEKKESKTPVKVVGMEAVVQLSTGKQHACAVLVDGTIKCWGANHAEQLGFGENQDSGKGSSNIPLAVYGIDKAVWVGVAESHTCAITADQNVRCWGQNSFGALGDESVEPSSVPVNTRPRLFAQQVDGGNTHTCAIVGEGKIRCWGANFGRFGNGTSDGSTQPVPGAVIDKKFKWLDAGESFNCAQTIGDVVYCWGQSNNYGSLGNNSFSDTLVPVQVHSF